MASPAYSRGRDLSFGVRTGICSDMERDSIQGQGRRDQDRSRVENLGTDDEEFASVEDTAPEPSENPAIDDV
jgi:hypothetical protein